jgi:hypothetical protein
MQQLVICAVLTVSLLPRCPATAAAVGIRNPNHLNDISSIFQPNSSCSDALDLTVSAAAVLRTLRQRPLLAAVSPWNVTLLGVNFGPGTTATHALHEVMATLFPGEQVLHYYRGYAHVLILIQQCIGIKDGVHYGAKLKAMRDGLENDTLNCNSSNILFQLTKQTEHILTTFKFVSDTPMAALFPDLVLTVPGLLAASTYRGLDSYLKSRTKHHNDDLICNQELWDNPTILHPFDIVACLRLKNTTAEALEHVALLKSGLFELAYKKQNSVNSIIARTHTKHHLLPICLDDMERNQSKDLLTKNVITFFAETNTTWGCPNVKNSYPNCTEINQKKNKLK